jgi:hypothetical protein
VSLACIRSQIHRDGCIDPDCQASGVGCKGLCRMARRHLDECADSGMGADCGGCLPRPATHGLICEGDHRRLERSLYEIPRVLRLLHGHKVPGQRGQSGDRICVTKGDPPAPMDLDIFDLERRLEFIVEEWARDHADRVGQYVTRAGEPIPIPDPVAHLVLNLASIECGDGIADQMHDLHDAMSKAHALVPWRPETTYLTAPCPECHCRAMVKVGGDDWMTCRECHATIPEDRYGLWSLAGSARCPASSGQLWSVPHCDPANLEGRHLGASSPQ